MLYLFETWLVRLAKQQTMTIAHQFDLFMFARSLSKEAEFFDVEGIPVSLGEPSAGLYSAAWDVSPPRPFDSESARRNGAPVSLEQFSELVTSQEWAKVDTAGNSAIAKIIGNRRTTGSNSAHATAIAKSSTDEPSNVMRISGAVVVGIATMICVTVIVAILDDAGASSKTIRYFSQICIFTGPVLAMVGWKWPREVLNPFKNCAKLVGAKFCVRGDPLPTPIQRALFAIACLSWVPWIVMHPIYQLWHSNSASHYLYRAFVDPFLLWSDYGTWSSPYIEWYDWLMLASLTFLFLAFFWPHTGARILRWIHDARR